MRVAYYVPKIPDIYSVAQFNHALAIAKAADNSLLMVHKKPPEQIANTFDEIKILESGVEADAGNLRRILPNITRARRAVSTVEDYLDKEDTFVTTWQYAPALAGWFADRRWVLDIYDDPHQKFFNNPRSVHQVLARVLRQILRQADRAVHTFHPNSPRLFGRERRFAINGAAASKISPRDTPSRGPLRCIWAGHPRLDRGMRALLNGVARASCSVHLDVYGRSFKPAQELAGELGVDDAVNFHGRCPHNDVIKKVQTSHVGVSTYPCREDWSYAYPIKVGEYMAAGTIPLCSPLQGIREVARGAGVYTEPTGEAIAGHLEELAAMDDAQFETMAKTCRSRAEAIDWRDERAWFATQALE